MSMTAVYSDRRQPHEAMTPLEAKLLELAAKGKSAVEIGNAVNLPPETALMRVRELLERREVWSERERFALYLDDLYELKTWLQAEVEATGDPRAVSNLIRALEQLGKTLIHVSEVNKATADVVTETQAKFLVSLVSRAFEYARDRLAEEHPDLPHEVIEAKFREGLVVASA